MTHFLVLLQSSSSRIFLSSRRVVLQYFFGPGSEMTSLSCIRKRFGTLDLPESKRISKGTILTEKHISSIKVLIFEMTVFNIRER
jgi:hypothetical protein